MVGFLPVGMIATPPGRHTATDVPCTNPYASAVLNPRTTSGMPPPRSSGEIPRSEADAISTARSDSTWSARPHLSDGHACNKIATIAVTNAQLIEVPSHAAYPVGTVDTTATPGAHRST